MVDEKFAKQFKVTKRKKRLLDIKVTYDGEYPNTCSGTLIIKVDGKEIYNKKYCCHSTGSISCDDNDYTANSGELIWDDADEYIAEIQEAVRNVLCGCNVCCGGCI